MNGIETDHPPPKQGCETPPQLAMGSSEPLRHCSECGDPVHLNYTMYLGCVYCPKCAQQEAHE